MQTFLVISTIFAFAYAVPIDTFEDSFGQQFYLVPISRQRRDTSIDVSKDGNGPTRVTLGQEGILDLGNSNQLSLTGFASKQYDPKGPTTLGGTLAIQNPIAGNQASVTVAKTPPYGTDVAVQAQKTLFKEQGATIQATIGASQHFGGTPGTSKADPSVGLEFQYSPTGGSMEYFICRMTGGSENSCASKG